jgi:hypothetical protein
MLRKMEVGVTYSVLLLKVQKEVLIQEQRQM